VVTNPGIVHILSLTKCLLITYKFNNNMLFDKKNKYIYISKFKVIQCNYKYYCYHNIEDFDKFRDTNVI